MYFLSTKCHSRVPPIDQALKKYEMGPSLNEDEMNRLGLRLLRTKKLKESIRTLELNVAAFPKSANAWDSLAEAYMIGGKELAIAYYRVARTQSHQSRRYRKPEEARCKVSAETHTSPLCPLMLGLHYRCASCVSPIGSPSR
jgi:hypothetical protein